MHHNWRLFFILSIHPIKCASIRMQSNCMKLALIVISLKILLAIMEINLWYFCCIKKIVRLKHKLNGKVKQKPCKCIHKHQNLCRIKWILLATSRYSSKSKRQTDADWLPLRNFSPEKLKHKDCTQTYRITRWQTNRKTLRLFNLQQFFSRYLCCRCLPCENLCICLKS